MVLWDECLFGWCMKLGVVVSVTGTSAFYDDAVVDAKRGVRM